MTFWEGCFVIHVEYKYLSKALETINLAKKNLKNNISQLNDYDEPLCQQRYRHGLVIFLCSNSNRLISLISLIAPDFRHLLSCGTIVLVIDTIKISQLGRCLLHLFLVEECNIRPKHLRGKPLKVLPSYNLILPLNFERFSINTKIRLT